MVQWIRICLPMQGTRVPSLVQENPACVEQLSPVGHNHSLSPTEQQEMPTHRKEEEPLPAATAQQQRPSAPLT